MQRAGWEMTTTMPSDNVVALGSRILLGQGRISDADRAARTFGPGLESLSSSALDDDVDAYGWLQANAPGWRLRVVLGRRTTPADGVGLPPGHIYQVILVFSDIAHRMAWQSHVEGQRLQAEKVGLRVARAREQDPHAVVCVHCGCAMQTYVRRQVSRQAQFGFAYTAHGHECPECGCFQLPPADADSSARMAARRAALDRVGLAAMGRLRTAAVDEEWRRREAVAAEVTVECLPGMSAEDILAELDRMLGRRISSRPVLRLVEENV
jgi:hypothetical protein